MKDEFYRPYEPHPDMVMTQKAHLPAWYEIHVAALVARLSDEEWERVKKHRDALDMSCGCFTNKNVS